MSPNSAREFVRIWSCSDGSVVDHPRVRRFRDVEHGEAIRGVEVRDEQEPAAVRLEAEGHALPARRPGEVVAPEEPDVPLDHQVPA